MRASCYLSAAGLAFFLLPSIAWADCPTPFPNNPTSDDVRACMTEIGALRAAVKTATSSGGIPTGAVMAFDLPSGCPDGWSAFKPATGRTVIGEGNQYEVGMEQDLRGQPLSAQKYRGHGGAQEHKLTINELPAHNDPFQIIEHGDYLRGNGGYHGVETVGRASPETSINAPVRYTENVGQGDTFSLMQPFVALFYCRKN